MKQMIAFLSLFTSVGTLLCCALPAVFVALGFGAAFAGLVGYFPQLVWFSENKLWLFAIGAVLLVSGGLLQWRAKAVACPIDPATGKACRTARDWSKSIYFASVVLYAIGAFFAFAAPKFF